MEKKDFRDRARQIKSLVNKDGEIPLSEKALDELFENLDPADLCIAKREYLLSLGMPEDAIDDDTMAGLTLAINIEDWAPALFRLLGMKKKRAKREKQRTIVLDTLEIVDNTSAVKIENLALMKQKIRRLVVSPPNGHTVNILKIIWEDPDTTQGEIAKELEISQGTVSKTLREIRKRLNS